jgi:hypothetical protein
LFLATGTEHSEEEYKGEYIWYYDSRHGQVTKDFTRTAKDEYDNPPVEVSETHASIASLLPLLIALHRIALPQRLSVQVNAQHLRVQS